jgi:MFS family permease
VLQRVFKAFSYRDFRLMWSGACASSIGTWMQKVAQSWLVLNMSNSAFLLGLDTFLGEIPIFLFSLIGGVVADRIDRRRVLLASQFLQMGCATLLTFLVFFQVVQVWHILCLSFVTGLAQAFGGPAYQALVPMLVERHDLPNAIALQSIQFNVARVIGPVLAGIALTQLGGVWCFGLNAVSFLAPVISLLMLHIRYVPGPTGASVLKSMKEGFGFILQQPAMTALIALAFIMTALAIPLLTFLPVFARDVFHGGPQVFTTFLVCSGVGSIVGALTVAALGNIPNKGRAALAMLVCLGAAMAAFSLSTSLVASCLLLFLSGAAMIAVFATISSLVQLITTDEMRGRVMSIYNVAFRGGMPFGSLTTGWLVPIFTAPHVLAVNGVLLLAAALYFLLVHRRVAAL